MSLHGFDPLQLGYEAIMSRRRRKWLQAPAARPGNCRVISVGNLTTGGTGKTPAVQYIARQLQAKGHQVAVVARGFRGTLSEKGALVSDGTTILLDAAAAGDEPLLHAHTLPGVAVLIGRDRVQAVARACGELQCDVVLLDDGFQYWSLPRDFDIVLLDARRPLDNGRLLPSGHLRERPQALARAAALVLTRCDLAGADAVRAARALLAHYSQAPVFETRHDAEGLVEASGAVTAPGSLRGARVGALSGLADNAAFAATLREQGAQVVWHAARRDHHVWRAAELQRAAAAAAQRGATCLVTTEKDRVKMAAPLFAASHLPIPLLALRIELQFLQGEAEFVQLVLAAAKGKGS